MHIKMIKSPFKSVYKKITGNPIIPQVKKNAICLINKKSRANIHQYSHLIENVAKAFSKQNHRLIYNESILMHRDDFISFLKKTLILHCRYFPQRIDR